ncbi:C47 family peptidase [uncultured Vagococcus sp.]|uniref:C47 family peptidase n=1 Tax=uncultured Vagococcus sp. TaxID=189676 RepID=UPI0028D3F2D1|nr:C47 family peptidase [uncultured Vagococcus sp.]
MKRVFSKKMLTVVLGIVCFFTITGVFDSVSAAENELTIQSKIVEPGATEFAKSDFGYSLSAILAAEKIGTSPENFVLSEPFVIEGSNQGEIYFPVLLDNNVEYVYILIQDGDGKYSSSVSRFLAEEIQELRANESIDLESYPVTFFLKNNNIFYKQNNEVTLLWESPIRPDVQEPEALENFVTNETEEFSIKSLSNEIDFVEQPLVEDDTQSIPNPLQRGVVIDTNYIMIDFVCRETQGNVPWCAAYATAWILSNKTNPTLTYAYDVMKHAYPNATFSELITKTASYDQIAAFARSKGASPIVTPTTLSGDNVRTLLKNGKPLYIGLDGISGDYLGKTHAMSLFGWVKQGNNESYYVWNPWNNYVTVASTNGSSLTVPVSGGAFTWKRTIYNM